MASSSFTTEVGSVFKIEPVSSIDGRRVWRLEGSLQGRAVDVLTEACRGVGSGQPVDTSALTLDLGRLRYVDRSGALALRTLTSRGVRLHRCPPLVRELLVEFPSSENC
jgi:hypothetical protein